MVNEIQTIALPILALISSGFFWTMGGYLANWRKNKDNPEWTGFEPKRLGSDLILGAILGVGAIVATYVLSTDLTPINNFGEFAVAVGAGFGIVAMVDKYIINGLLNK